MKILGTVAIASYAAHAIVHLSRGEPQDLLWACHIAALLVGIGLVYRSATINAIGLLWACFGTPLWILDLATGGEWMPTAFLTHAAALACGIVGVRRLGMPRAAAFNVTRAITPQWANVNIAFSVYQGWQRWFTSYPPYVALLVALAVTTFAIAEYLLTLLPRTERSA